MGFGFLNRFSRPATVQETPRIYAIGDIHGRMDLFERMIARIKSDVSTEAPRPTRIIVLGDFIDRGPASAAMVALLMQLRKEPNVLVLKGNHEAAMVDALDGDHGALDLWLEHGGLATLESFGVDSEELDLADSYQVLRAARAAVPMPVRLWMKQLPTFAHFDRYYFVHAGVKPGVDLDKQTDESRLWISDEFTSSDDDHGAVIVHGHTIYEDGVYVGDNRIGVDTGAYRTGRLSAVVIEKGEVRVLTEEM